LETLLFKVFASQPSTSALTGFGTIARKLDQLEAFGH
jgi:hypothetical protein